MKAVFDTNVLVAAFITEGVCAKLLVRARKGDFDLVLCPSIIQEFESVIKRKFSITPPEIAEASSVLSEAAREIRQQANPIPPVCRDPAADVILACAQAAAAEYLVTGDEDLLVLKNYSTTVIIRPRDFEALFSD